MRVQLRGSRSAILFTTYLVVMSFVLLMTYSSSLGNEGEYSLATAQRNLQGFYYATLGSLAVVITLVAPSMGAFAIVSEKQRRSLDLVFSAPTEPKYYLVGKLISSYRFVWLLLVLSLPFCAVSVTLGGTTWSQLFITFLLYSFYGMVCVSFGLLMSTLCSKVLPAIIWTYAALGCYLFITGMLFGVGAASTRGSMTQINPVFSLFPASFSFVADQTWPVFGKEFPSWLVTIAVHLLVVKFIILAAGALLAPGNSKEIRSLRIHSLIYSSAVTFLLGMTSVLLMASIFGMSTTVSTLNAQILHGRILFFILMTIGIMIVPHLASFGFNDLRRHRPDKIFSIRQTFSGRPSGNISFLIILFTATILSYVVGAEFGKSNGSFIPMIAMSSMSSSMTPSSNDLQPLSWGFIMNVYLAFAIWSVAFFMGWLGVCKAAILSRGRTLSLFFFVLGIILPTAIFAILAPEDRGLASGVWLLNPIAGIISDFGGANITIIHAFVLSVFAVILMIIVFPRVKLQTRHSFEPKQEVPHDRNQTIPAV